METTESAADSLINPSLRALLHDIVDYAGLFPPADLPLDEAMHNYMQYRHEYERWMLNRFVIPVKRLDELSTYAKQFRQGEPFSFSVLGTGGATEGDFLAAFDSDLQAIDAFDEYHAGAAQAEVMEVRLPASLFSAAASDIESFFDAIDAASARAGIAKLDLFLEIPLAPQTHEAIERFAAAAAEFNSRQSLPARTTIGLKIRCGGVHPEEVPDVEHVAHAITTCRNAGVRMKATAGLHHPVRHHDDDVGTMMHGFFNVFGAAVMASEHKLDKAGVQAILNEDNAENFQFLKDSFAWRDVRCPIAGVDHARENLITSFGSCSFEEPVDDLQDLDLM
ncbi:hypothetical protein CRI94_06025 [Longibacter salinarum]|uniref:Aldolase n=1 Tax=Longibacter salinarum TaxID=1850348 RepID=A0A2A8D192_9BACT|nr:hypothetical protein [Longibacter salinarum]PEN14686.1 hypothetical protein CRI94_06025 [Longibacter salinarum]